MQTAAVERKDHTFQKSLAPVQDFCGNEHELYDVANLYIRSPFAHPVCRLGVFLRLPRCRSPPFPFRFPQKSERRNTDGSNHQL